MPWRLGITGRLWHWFKDYLSNRHHFVVTDQVSSVSLPVLSGVPQGSILGPLLFLVYINDLPESIDYASCYLFADYAKLAMPIKVPSDSQGLQRDLDKLCQWCDEWKLQLNLNKCHFMRLSYVNQSHDHAYHIRNFCIDNDQSQRDLGIEVSNNMSWSKHYNKICKKAYGALNMIKRNTLTISSVYLKKQLYLTLVRSNLTYCCQLWRPRLIKDITSLERVQRRATKFILNYCSMSYKARLETLKILPLMYWYELQDLLFLIKLLKNPQDNVDIGEHITFITSLTIQGTSGTKLKVQYNRTSIGRHFYYNRVVRLWNRVDHSIDLSLSIPSIKNKLKEVLLGSLPQQL